MFWCHAEKYQSQTHKIVVSEYFRNTETVNYQYVTLNQFATDFKQQHFWCRAEKYKSDHQTLKIVVPLFFPNIETLNYLSPTHNQFSTNIQDLNF